MSRDNNYKAIVIGASAGGLQALSFILQKLPVDYALPVLIVQHRAKDQKELLEELLQEKCRIKIKQADEKETIEPAHVYIAPPGYHLLVERDKTLSLSADGYVSYSRPSIDVLFQTAAIVFKHQLAAIILTGANADGAAGIEMVSKYGGLTIAQNTDEAAFAYMPKAAIETGKIQQVYTLLEIQQFLLTISHP